MKQYDTGFIYTYKYMTDFIIAMPFVSHGYYIYKYACKLKVDYIFNTG